MPHFQETRELVGIPPSTNYIDMEACQMSHSLGNIFHRTRTIVGANENT
jgi:hypothetical protein